MRHLHRPAAVLAAGALIATTIAGAAQAAPADRSGQWLDRQLTDGLVHNDQYDFDDYGLTADTAIALDAIGGHRPAVKQVRKALAGNVDAWTTFGDDVYAGSVAKALVLAETTGADPRSFGGVDLVKRLAARVSSSKPTVGRIQDKAQTDYANTIGQALAARGLAKAGSGKADEAVRFLLEQQCSAGYFRLNFAGLAKKDQSCDAGKRATTSAPDTDVTALAVLNLRATPHKTKAVRSAIKDAVAWLKRHQKDNGSFGGGPATEASNANSTGLAGWALAEAGACKPAARAARWVKGLQVSGDVSGTPLAGEKGAIAYDRAAFKAAKSDGIGDAQRDQWRRATSQAAPALAYLQVENCR
ncbi:hypothetical protein ACT8ZV_20375 [Nocardioides sp. MAHUQ-72]|uniref:hypothetical protein n=1 Tax=unclassified Nocardioides TaxID=2615069 RepID=UPI0036094DAD